MLPLPWLSGTIHQLVMNEKAAAEGFNTRWTLCPIYLRRHTSTKIRDLLDVIVCNYNKSESEGGFFEKSGKGKKAKREIQKAPLMFFLVYSRSLYLFPALIASGTHVELKNDAFSPLRHAI